MKNFVLETDMVAKIGGAFYPTGYSMVMFPAAKDAAQIGGKLVEAGFSGDDIYLIPADIVLSEISPTVGDADNPLPSAGTDGATVRAYTKLAQDGHAGLLVKTKDEETAERMMEIVRTVPYSIAQRYRMLVIEDL